MAVIKSAIQITDGMTPAFRSMTNAMNIVLSSFERLQSVSGNAIDIGSITNARVALNNVNSAITQVETNLRQSSVAQGELNSKMVSGSTAAGGLLDQVKTLAATYLSIQGVKGLLAMADEATNTYSRLTLMNDGLQTTEELQNKIFESANRSYASYKDTADAVAKMGNLAGEAFNNNDEIIQFTELLNKNFIIAGTSAEGIRSAMLQLTQAMSAGVLRGQDFNSMLQNGGQFAQYLADYLHVPKGELKDMAAQGQISAKVVKNAMLNAADKINPRFNGMSNAFKDIWNLFRNEAEKAMSPVLLQLRELSSSEGFKQFAKDAGAAIGNVASAMTIVLKGLGTIAMFVRNNWALILPVLAAVTAATVVYAASLAWANREVVINAAMTAWKAVCDWAETAAIIAMTFAQNGLNAAMALCPITWIIYGIIAVIAIFYLAVAAYNEFTGSAVSGTGLIVGSIYWLGAVAFNIFMGILNIGITVAEALINGFNTAVFTVESFFYDLASNFLAGCYSMATGWDAFANAMSKAFVSAINSAIKAWNRFMDILPDTVKTTLSIGKGSYLSADTVNTAGTVASMQAGLQAPVANKPVSLARGTYMDTKDAFDAGYGQGAKLGQRASGAVQEVMKKAGANQQGINGTGDGSGGSGGSGSSGGGGGKGATEKTLKDIANQLSGDEEYLKLLRTVAERDVINKFTTASIALDIRNNNNINSGLDLDGIVGGLTDKLTDQMVAAAEGGHV